MAADRKPFPVDPNEFADDTRISLDRVTGTYKLEDERNEEWEWNENVSKWVPVTDEALIQQQQMAYMVPGVDENEPAMDPKKRKAQHDADNDGSNGKAKKVKADVAPTPQKRRNNAIYITSLPLDTDEDELLHVFQRYGVIAESADTNRPRIKLYTDEKGRFKGDALIVYFRPESVHLAIDMLDETDFRLGQPVITGPMRVTEADSSFKSQKEQPLATDQAKKKGSGANRDRQKIIKKNQELNNRLADWDDDDPQTLPETSRWAKVMVLKHMFTLKELAEDPAALLDITEDIREECEKLGRVTNVTLYDKEEDGVATVRFSDATTAASAIGVFNGRIFDSRRVEAYIADGEERFKKNKKQEDGAEDEAERLEGFSKFIEDEGA